MKIKIKVYEEGRDKLFIYTYKDNIDPGITVRNRESGQEISLLQYEIAELNRKMKYEQHIELEDRVVKSVFAKDIRKVFIVE